MSNPFSATVRVCASCKAENAADAGKCWLCYAPLDAAPQVIMAELVDKPRGPSPLTEGFFLTLTLACLALLVIVGIGLARDDAGLLIPYTVLLAPPILATVSRSLLRASRGQRISAMEVFLTFLVSASVTVLIVVVLFVAAVAALFVYCLYVCGGGR